MCDLASLCIHMDMIATAAYNSARSSQFSDNVIISFFLSLATVVMLLLLSINTCTALMKVIDLPSSRQRMMLISARKTKSVVKT